MFKYLIEKINLANIEEFPFPHLEIKNFFSDNDFDRIITSNQIKISPAQSDNELFDYLFKSGYKIIDFPGCISNKKEYIDWHKKKEVILDHTKTCETFGMTLRLDNIKDNFLEELSLFIHSDDFINAISSKFSILSSDTYFDGGFQKYLDGYEISPHPDIRRKALTFMININPSIISHEADHHTSYLSFKKEYASVYKFWEDNYDTERCWVPWSWCKIEKIQNINNSIVIFSPNNRSLHGIKSNYDHLLNQRTQIYGNLWFKDIPSLKKVEWNQLGLSNNIPIQNGEDGIFRGIMNKLKRLKYKSIYSDKYRIKSKNNSGKYD